MHIQILRKAQTTLMGIEKNDGKLANRSSRISLRSPDDQLPGHRKGGWKNPTRGDKLDCLSMVIQDVIPKATPIHTSYKMSNVTTEMYIWSTKYTITFCLQNIQFLHITEYFLHRPFHDKYKVCLIIYLKNPLEV